jgi:metacaspase-1
MTSISRLTGAAVLLSATVLSLPSEVTAKTRALVIGINEYPTIRVNGVGGARNLRGATNDAKNVKEALTKHFEVKPDEIKLLADREATREAILANFRKWLIEDTERGDRVVFYYAGHGAQVEDDSGDEGDDKFDEVLVPSDTDGELEGPDAGLSGFITDDEIGKLIDELPGREVVMIVDACHSGTITRGALEIRESGASDDPAGQGIDADGIYTGVRTLTPNGPVGVINLTDLATREAHRTGTRMIEVVGTAPPVAATTEVAATPTPAASATDAGSVQLAVWTAAASAQLAVEDKDLGGSEGLFTNRFVKGIAEGAADLNRNGNITASELLAFLRSESDSYCSRHQCGAGGLSPTLEAWGGYDDHTIGEYSASATPPPQDYGTTIATSDALPEYGYPTAGGVKVSLTGGESLRYGDPLRIKIDSQYAGELIVLDIRDDGTTVQLFPNSPSLKVGAETSIKAGETRVVPGDEDPFELVPDKPGSGRIVALVVDPYADVEDVTKGYLELEPIPSPEDYVARISQEMNRTIVYPSGSEDALYQPARGGTLARGEAKYVIE